MKRTLVGGILVLAAVAAAGLYAARRARPAGEAAYQTVRVERGRLQTLVMTTGTVKPQNRLEIKSPIAGRVEETLVREGDAVQRGQILAWISSAERAALLDAARARGTNELAYWEQLYRPAPLVAPLDGTIIARSIEPGQAITASDVLYVLSDRLIVEAQVDETDIGQIRIGQPAAITLDAYPERAVSGRVDHIAFEAQTVNNVTTYMAEVLPERVPPFMRSGMTANLRILTALTNDVLLLPVEAVRTRGDRSVARQPGRTPQESPRETPVTLGLSDGKWVEIKTGLAEGDTVLVESAYTLAPRPEAPRNPFMPARPGGARRR